MAGIVQLLIAARDATGPAFASARAELLGLATSGSQTSASMMELSTASSAAGVRMTALSERIFHQEGQLGLLGMQIESTTAKYGIMAIQTQRQILSFDRLTTSINADRAALQRLQAEQDTARTGASRLSGGVGGLTSSLGALGVTLGTTAIAGWAIGAGQAANSLEKTEATLHQLIPNMSQYDSLMKLAGSNQRLFGGSLDQNLQGLQGLALLARNASTDLGTLNASAQKLTIKSPEQGSTGAMVALTELLTGKGAESTRSLRMRYELTAEGLNKIESATTVKEKLAALDAELATFGVTNETVTARLNTTAQSYSDLGITAERMKLGFGKDVADTFEPLVKWLDMTLSRANDTAEALGKIKAAAFTGDKAQPAATTYDQYVTRIRDANKDMLARGAPHSVIRPMSPSEFYRSVGDRPENQNGPAGGGGSMWGSPVQPAGSGSPVTMPAGSSGVAAAPVVGQTGGAAPIIVNIQSTLVETDRITSLVQEGLREYNRANGRPY